MSGHATTGDPPIGDTWPYWPYRGYSARPVQGCGNMRLSDFMALDTEQVHYFKRDKLLDILRRVIANPEKAQEVADALTLDWKPTLKVDATGHVSLLFDGGKKILSGNR